MEIIESLINYKEEHSMLENQNISDALSAHDESQGQRINQGHFTVQRRQHSPNELAYDTSNS